VIQICVYRVLSRAEKRLDAQMLLDSFDEQLDMPAAFVKPRDGQSRKLEIVGDEEPDRLSFSFSSS
jgi:hypothetical protein